MQRRTSLGRWVGRGGHLVAAPGPVAGSVVEVAARDDAAHVAALVDHAQVAQPQRHERHVGALRWRLRPVPTTVPKSLLRRIPAGSLPRTPPGLLLLNQSTTGTGTTASKEA